MSYYSFYTVLTFIHPLCSPVTGKIYSYKIFTFALLTNSIIIYSWLTNKAFIHCNSVFSVLALSCSFPALT